MKKLIALVLALVICFSLCACGSSTSKEEGSTSIEKDYIGTWQTEDGETVFSVYEGGIGSFNGPGNKFSFTWEIKGTSLVIDNKRYVTIYNVDKNSTPHQLTSPTSTYEFYKVD